VGGWEERISDFLLLIRGTRSGLGTALSFVVIDRRKEREVAPDRNRQGQLQLG
jgi:hypothetical protein